MAIEFVEHFERGDNDQTIASGGSTVTGSTVLSGSRSLQQASTGPFYSLPSTSTKIFHYLARYQTFDSTGFVLRWDNAATAAVLGGIKVNTGTHFIEAYTGNAALLVATSSFALNTVTNYHFQVKVIIHDSTGLIEVKVNGVVRLTFSGDTKPTAATDIDQFGITAPDGGSGHRVDDIVVDNANYLGDIRVKYFYPTANGSHTGWTGTYADVDDAFANDDDTTKITSIADGDKESFTYPAHGLETTATVLAVCPEAVAKGTAASIKLGYRIGGTDYMGSAQVLGGSYDIYQQINAVDPSDSNAWTLGDLVPETVIESEI